MIITVPTTKQHHNSAYIDFCIASIARGNDTMLETLYELTSAAVYGYALSILKNAHDAEDVLHDCFLCIHASAASYHATGKPLAWILKITKNLCLQKFREVKKQIETESVQIEAWPQTADVEDRFVLEQYLNLLTAEEREILLLHIVAGFKHREIAAFLDLPLATLLSKHHRALKKLKKHLTQEDGQHEKS